MAAVDFKRGVYSTVSGLTGTFLYTGLTKTFGSSEDSVADEKGNTAGAVLFDRVTTIKLTANFAVGATIPGVGGTLTIDSVAYGITNVGEAQNNKTAVTLDIDAKYYENNAFAPTLLATTTTTT